MRTGKRFAIASGTCLINYQATPVGTGEIHLAYFDVGTFNLMYPHVTHPK